MPQRENSNYWEHISKADHTKWKDKLGNLTLENKSNTPKKDSTFKKKSDVFGNSKLNITRTIPEFNENGSWTAESMQRRQDWLLEEIGNILRIKLN
jgi:hypothetical protein